jgi:hypothetical protein
MNAEKDPAARIDARIRELRATLAHKVVAIDEVNGFTPTDGIAFVLPAGGRVPADHFAVALYPDAFRPLSPDEIERAVRSERYQLEFELGLG